MKKFRVYFEMGREYGDLIIEANSKDEVEEEFEMLSLDDVMDMAYIIPECEIDYIEEIDEED